MPPDEPSAPEAGNSTSHPPRLIRLARWVVLGLVLFSVAVLLYSIALFPAYLSGATADLAPNDSWTNEMTQTALDQLGWSPLSLAWFFAVLGWITAATFCAVGLVVFRHKSQTWFGLYVAVAFAVLGTSAGVLTPTAAAPTATAQAAPLLASWLALTGTLAWQAFFILFYLFPDGRFVPPWTRWLLLGWLMGNVAGLAAPSRSASPGLLGLLFVGLVITAVASQIYRYVRVSNPLQRQQTKWIAFMGGVFLLFIIPQLLTFTVLAPERGDLATSFLASIVMQTLSSLWFFFLPIAIGIAILRYRLWDIDIIIRRTLVYLPLTAILAGVFAASIRLLQALFSPVSGQQSGAATALTTLIVVAAFDPIKGWLQRLVDARFKEISNPEGRWKAYGDRVREFVQMNDAEAIGRKLLEEAMAVFDAKNGAFYLQKAEEMQLVHTQGPWQNGAEILIPLEHQGRQLGRLALGARRNGSAYGLHEQELLAQNANAVAAAIALVGIKNAPTTGATRAA